MTPDDPTQGETPPAAPSPGTASEDAPHRNGEHAPRAGVILATGEEADAAATRPLLEYRPPPVRALPAPLADYIEASADAIGCDPALVAIPALAACAAAIGDSRALQVRAGWQEFPVLWTLAVAPSGAMKTPAMKAAMAGMEDAQRAAWERFASADAGQRKAFAEWAGNGKKGPEPTKPVLESYYIGDATLEAVCARLHDNPRGLLQKRDELSGWLGSFNQYNDGNDAAQWLEFHSASPLRVDRKGGGSPTLYIPRAMVSVTGTIQEPILRRLLADDGGQHFDNGLAARFLMSMPPERERRWREQATPEPLRRAFVELFRELLNLSPQMDTATGRREPVVLQWHPAAKASFAAYYDTHAAEMHAFRSDRLKSAWSKLEAAPPRLALLFHVVSHAYLPRPDASAATVSLGTLEAATEWAEWFKAETRRIYYTMSNQGDGRKADRLLNYTRRIGGRCTARDAARVGAGGRTAEEVERLMGGLVAAGLAGWTQGESPKGGRPTRYFSVKNGDPLPRN